MPTLPGTPEGVVRLSRHRGIHSLVLQMQDGPDPQHDRKAMTRWGAILELMTDPVGARGRNVAPHQYIIDPLRQGWFGIAQVFGMAKGEAGIVACLLLQASATRPRGNCRRSPFGAAELRSPRSTVGDPVLSRSIVASNSFLRNLDTQISSKWVITTWTVRPLEVLRVDRIPPARDEDLRVEERNTVLVVKLPDRASRPRRRSSVDRFRPA